MIKFLYRINAAFDRMAPNPRFLTFMAMMVPAIFAQGIAEHFELIMLYSASWIYLLLMLTVRMLYMHGAFKSGKPPKTVPLSNGDNEF